MTVSYSSRKRFVNELRFSFLLRRGTNTCESAPGRRCGRDERMDYFAGFAASGVILLSCSYCCTGGL